MTRSTKKRSPMKKTWLKLKKLKKRKNEKDKQSISKIFSKRPRNLIQIP